MRILAPPSASFSLVEAGLRRVNAHATFIGTIFPAVWAAARRYSVDPVGAVAQAAHETGLGHFGGRIDARWMNTCGLKIRDITIVPGHEHDRDHPLCHASFGSWEIGARAHVQHLVAYAGGIVEPWDLVDPRYVWVAGRYRCEHFADLSGKWAPSSTYGVAVENMAKRLTTS